VEINYIKNMDDLAAKIKELEAIDTRQMESLKLQLHGIKESLQPGALIKSSLRAIASSTEVKGTALTTTAGVAAGWVARKLFTLNSKSLIRKAIGYGLQLATTKLVAKKLPQLTDNKKNL